MKTNLITAVGVAIINKEGKILIAKRLPDKPMPDKWEFPGGKLESNETLEECGVREIKEELELDIRIDTLIGVEEIEYKNRNFCLYLYTAYLKDEDQELKLNEHSQAEWVEFEDFKEYDFPANRLSFIKELKKQLKK